MTRRIPLLALLALLLGLAAVAPRMAESGDEWSDLAKRFKKGFKPKKTSLSTRKDLVKSVRRTDDPRAVPLFLKALDDQRDHAADLLKAWNLGMVEWQEKTTRLEKLREERVRRVVERAKKKGRKPSISVDLTSESGRWLGAPPKHPGEMIKARKRLMDRLDEVRAERSLLRYVRQGIVSVMRDIEGEAFDNASKSLLREVKRTRDDERVEMLGMLGYVRGEAVTDLLLAETKERKIALVQAALAALGRQNSERGRDALLGYLDHEDWGMRSAALSGLVFYRDVKVMDALLARAAKEDGVVRRRIFQTMASIVGERVKAILEAWQSWWPSNKADIIARWERMPREGPVTDDPPKFPVETEGSGAGTSFYGIKTDSKHIIFVADISGSMRRTDKDPAGKPAKIDVCRDELKRAIRGLSASDEDDRGAATFNIVLFSTELLVYKPGKMVKATKRNKEKAYKWIEEHVKPDMQTNIYDAIAQAFNIISAGSASKNRDRGADTIFLMTDGAPSRGKFVRPAIILEEVRRLNKTRGITLHTIGVGKGHNVGFLQRLAADSGGQYLSRD